LPLKIHFDFSLAVPHPHRYQPPFHEGPCGEIFLPPFLDDCWNLLSLAIFVTFCQPEQFLSLSFCSLVLYRIKDRARSTLSFDDDGKFSQRARLFYLLPNLFPIFLRISAVWNPLTLFLCGAWTVPIFCCFSSRPHPPRRQFLLLVPRFRSTCAATRSLTTFGFTKSTFAPDFVCFLSYLSA